MRYMRNPRFAASVFSSTCFALILALSAPSISSATAIEPLKPAAVHSETIREIAERLEDSHFSQTKIDDKKSSEVLDKYIELLDSGKYFFLQSDIDAFEIHRTKMDDYIEKGDNSVPFDIYNQYLQRASERLEFAIDFLEHKVKSLDYTKHEEFATDREMANWASDPKELDDIWRKRIKNDLLKLKLAGKDPKDAQDFLLKRYQRQRDLLVKSTAEDAFSVWASALTLSYDPHSTYFSPAEMENFNIAMRLSLQGIGAVLSADNEYTKVVKLIPGGPAKRSKALSAGDRIIGVGQGEKDPMTDVIGWRLNDVVQLIRGEKGTKVRLKIVPNGLEEQFAKEITLVRDKINLEEQAASKKIIEHEHNGKHIKLGVIVLPSFYLDFDAYRRGDPNFRSTTRDVARLIHELKKEDIQGLVIDLRNNGGGSLTEVNHLIGLFIKYGPTVQVKSLDETQPYKDRDPTVHWAGPLAVLVNRFSASASEIFAGAIQDYDRGVVIGERTYGKGTVQNVMQLENGMLKFTNAKFYRISGESTQHKGVVPDIEFPDMVDHKIIGESASKNALAWDRIAPLDYSKLNDVHPVLRDLLTRHEMRKKTDPFFHLLEEQSALNREIGARKKVTLNEAERKKISEQLEHQKLALENKRRALDGLPPLESIALVEDDSEADTDPADKDGEKEPTDAFLQESLNIMTDLIELSRARQVSQTH